MERLFHLVGYVVLIITASCNNSPQQTSNNVKQDSSELENIKTSNVEEYSPRLKDIKSFNEGYIFLNKGDSMRPSFLAIPIKYKLIDDLAIFQGDIILGDAAKFRQQTKFFQEGVSIESLATEISILKWTEKRVYYFIERNAERYRSTIQDAIQDWQNNTDIQFQEITQKRGNYILIVRREGYSSPIGMQGGEQILTIPADPQKGNIMHEIGHAIGLWHEHSRKDRDEYVKVIYENIKDAYKSDFDCICCDVTTYNTSYDFGSLMHYPEDAFSKGGNTIEAIHGERIGQRENISYVDKEGVSKLYN